MSILNNERTITLGEFRRIALEEIKRLLLYAKAVEESNEAGGFQKRVPPPLIVLMGNVELYSDIKNLRAEIVKKYPNQKKLANESVRLAEMILKDGMASDLLETYREVLLNYGYKADSDGQNADGFSVRQDANRIYIQANEIGKVDDGISVDVVNNDYADHGFVASVSNLLAIARKEERPLTLDERSAVVIAYRLLDKGVQIPSAYKSIGVYGFREHQTNLSVANPGDGHIQVTCSSNTLLSGTVVHIEHIDRDGYRDREKLEPYRLPAIINAARVRLHAGSASPCTAYIGRPVFESADFNSDILKAVHTISGACTSMFMNGIADCKIGIERMTALQSIKFMRAVAGNVVRDATRQYLSAAFNINLPIIDDRNETSLQINDRFEIAKLGIELALRGGFEKVTWDGSSNQEPSIPIIKQLSYEQLIDLIHTAHEKGLETYISAGLQPSDMAECTYLGVDGVGIGTSLHDYNPASGLRGQLKKERVEEVLHIRNVAAITPLGRGAALLAKLDRMYFEGTLPQNLNNIRKDLFIFMRSRNENEVDKISQNLGQIPGDMIQEDHPVIEQAKRMINSTQFDSIGATRYKDWNDQVKNVEKLIASRDIAELYEILP